MPATCSERLALCAIGLYLAFRSPEPVFPSRPVGSRSLSPGSQMPTTRSFQAACDFSALRSTRVKTTRFAGGRAAGLDPRGQARKRRAVGSGRNAALVPPGEMNRDPSRHGIGLPLSPIGLSRGYANLSGTIDTGHIFEKDRGQKRAGSERGVRQQSHSGDDDESAM